METLNEAEQIIQDFQFLNEEAVTAQEIADYIQKNIPKAYKDVYTRVSAFKTIGEYVVQVNVANKPKDDEDHLSTMNANPLMKFMMQDFDKDGKPNTDKFSLEQFQLSGQDRKSVPKMANLKKKSPELAAKALIKYLDKVSSFFGDDQ